MNEEANNRDKWLHLRLTKAEYDLLHKHFKQTTCRKLSDYARKILLAEPVATTVRNQSLDDFVSEAIKLRTELNSIGNNFNQAVKKLYSLNQIAEFRDWIVRMEMERRSLLGKTEEIKAHIQKFIEKWLP